MAFAAILALLTGSVSFADGNTRVIVSIGDSYSSGEGMEPFYGQDAEMAVKCQDPDWLGHRSEKAWPGMLTLPGVDGPMREHRGENWFFVATSGAETINLFQLTDDEIADGMTAAQEKKYSRDGFSGTAMVPPQLDVFDELDAKGLKADYVTMTIGGNDINFVRNVTLTFLGLYGLVKGSDEYKMNILWKIKYKRYHVRDNIKRVFTDTAFRAGDQAWIIVAGYPRLVDPRGGDIGFPKEDARIMNLACDQFNAEIRSIVDECRSEGMKICFVSVTEAFEGHGAYADDPYINPVIISAQSQDLKTATVASNYSMHPNEKGIQVYARCVQEMIDRLENGEDVQ